MPDCNTADSRSLRKSLPSLVRKSFKRFRLSEIVRIRQLVLAEKQQADGPTQERNRKWGATADTSDDAPATRTSEQFTHLPCTTSDSVHNGEDTIGVDEEEAGRGDHAGTKRGLSEECRPPGCDGYDKLFLLELFHGPTFAFKDIALQFLGELLAYLQREEKKPYVILGATSGDTGSAAIAALQNKSPHLHTIILFPKDRVSPIQKLQMVTANDPTVHCLQVDGTFDDCQEMVKTVLKEEHLRQQNQRNCETETTADNRKQSPCTPETTASSAGRLCVVNSINCMRILVQTAYWWYSALQLEKLYREPPGCEDYPSRSLPTFVVPTGNFGNIFSCLFAKMMGAPIGKLLLATNSNDVLVEAYNYGSYRKRDTVYQTYSPSMDIAAASNFERLLHLEKLLRTQQEETPNPAEEVVHDQLSKSCSAGEEQADETAACGRSNENATQLTGNCKAKNACQNGLLPDTAAPAATPPTPASTVSCLPALNRTDVSKGVNGETTHRDEEAALAKMDECGTCRVSTAQKGHCAASAYLDEVTRTVTAPPPEAAPLTFLQAKQRALQGGATVSLPAAEEPSSEIGVAQAETTQLSPEELRFFRKYFLAVSVSDEEALAAMRHMFSIYNEIIDPHTAVGYAAYIKLTQRSAFLRSFNRRADMTHEPPKAEFCGDRTLDKEINDSTRAASASNSIKDNACALERFTASQFLLHRSKNKQTAQHDVQRPCECTVSSSSFSPSSLSACSTSSASHVYLLACTAHFGKFPETVLPQVGWAETKRIPQELQNLEALQKQYEDIPARADLLRKLVDEVFVLAARDDCT